MKRRRGQDSVSHVDGHHVNTSLDDSYVNASLDDSYVNASLDDSYVDMSLNDSHVDASLSGIDTSHIDEHTASTRATSTSLWCQCPHQPPPAASSQL